MTHEAFGFLLGYIGPVLWALIPVSVLAQTVLLYVLYTTAARKAAGDWPAELLAFAKETALMLGLLGSVYALATSFQFEPGTAPAAIRARMFATLSTGFWSTVCGALIALQASVGLLILKRT